MSHAPGPWTHKKDHTDEGIPVYCIRDSRDEWVADTNAMWWMGEDTALANARLIAAAPDLLKALQNMRECLKNWSSLGAFDHISGMSDLSHPDVINAACDQVGEAIRKALGQ